MGLKQGTLLKNGEYRIEKVLGQGGFGITYLAVQVALDRKVAIKEFFMKGVCERDAETSQVSISNADNKELVSRFREKFLKEARSLASLEHRNIVSVIDVFECNGTAYYVMKHLGGASLADKVKQGALPEADAVRYISQVASALEYVHGRNMMHLDVKPANILLDDTDNAVLIDFGLAKQYDTEGQQTSTTPVGISHGYAPMEQYRRGGVSSFSPASDIYSLGATLYKLVTGATPPEASDVNDEGLPVLPSDISLAVRTAIEAAMQPKRKDRPQSIADFLAMLTEREKPESQNGKVIGESDNSIAPGEIEVTAVSSDCAVEDKTTPCAVDEAEAETRNIDEDNAKGAETVVPVTPVAPKAPKTQSDPIASPKTKNTEKAKSGGGNLVPAIVAVLCLLGVIGIIGIGVSFMTSSSDVVNFDDTPTSESTVASDVINGHEYVDLGLSVKWATCNVGASSPEQPGDYYAWGETTTKSDYSGGSYKYLNGNSYINIGNDISGTEYDVARAKWGSSWRLPTKKEMEELKDKCTWEWTTQNGENGYKVTGPNGNSIFLPAAGCRNGTELNYRDSFGDYWSGTLGENYSKYACKLSFYSRRPAVDYYFREDGLTVRPVSK